jgi:hypothetical protein
VSHASGLAAQEETRLALAAVAARTERQNQPKALLYAAGLLLVGAMIFLGVSFQGSVAAAKELATQKKQAEDVAKQAGRLKALREYLASDPGVNQAAPQVLTRIEQAAVDVGLKVPTPLMPSARHNDRAPGATSQLAHLDYEIRAESLPLLLQWVQKAQDNVPGLEVYGVSLRPASPSGAHQWVLRVSFARWEKVEG